MKSLPGRDFIGDVYGGFEESPALLELPGYHVRAMRGWPVPPPTGQRAGGRDAGTGHRLAESHQGEALVVYGHTPVSDVRWLDNTVRVDASVLSGGELSAMRHPEREIVSLRAKRVYYPAAQPGLPGQSYPSTQET